MLVTTGICLLFFNAYTFISVIIMLSLVFGK